MSDPKKIEIKNTNYDVGLTELIDLKSDKNKMVWKTPSKMRMNPKKYNFTQPGSRWKHNEMDWAQAEELVNEFYKNKKCPQKLSMTYFQDFNRIKNLGFKDEEVSKMYYNDPKNLIDCIKRKQEIKLKYMEKVI